MCFNKCPICGAYLDPCETCDCEEKEAASSGANTESGIEKISTARITDFGGFVNDKNIYS